MEKLGKYDLMMDGEVGRSDIGQVATFMGMDGELITINDFRVGGEEGEEGKESEEDGR